MSSNNVVGQEVSDGDRADEHEADWADAERFEVVNETPELRPNVEQTIQAKVDTNHPDAKSYGLTLEAEERLAARELEIERTRTRWDRSQESEREQRTSEAAMRGSIERRAAFEERAACVGTWRDPATPDPREGLSREDLGAVNREAMRIHERVHGSPSRAVLARQLGERVEAGRSLTSAVVGVYEEAIMRQNAVVPVNRIAEVPRGEVTVEGRVKTLWKPSHPAIAQVGLLEDETGVVKFTVWAKSRQPLMDEGELVRVRHAAKNWYEGRCSIALTGWSTVSFPERGRWWTE